MTLIGVLTIGSKVSGGNLFMLSLGKTKESTVLLLAALKFAVSSGKEPQVLKNPCLLLGDFDKSGF
jgi:hypothetical protein